MQMCMQTCSLCMGHTVDMPSPMQPVRQSIAQSPPLPPQQDRPPWLRSTGPMDAVAGNVRLETIAGQKRREGGVLVPAGTTCIFWHLLDCPPCMQGGLCSARALSGCIAMQKLLVLSLPSIPWAGRALKWQAVPLPPHHAHCSSSKDNAASCSFWRMKISC